MNFKVKSFIKISLILSAVILGAFTVYYFWERNTETYYEYKYRTSFYQMMRKKNKFDFIKTGEKELENIDFYIKQYKDDEYILFRYYLVNEKIRLIEEIEKTKLRIYCKEGKVKLSERPGEYKIFVQKYPELVEKFKDYGKVLQYEKIDYMKIFNEKEQKERKSMSEELLKVHEDSKYYSMCDYKRLELMGIENFGLDFNELDLKKLSEYKTNESWESNYEQTLTLIEEWERKLDNIKKQLNIKDGIQDLFYENNKAGSISTKNKDEELICSFQFDNLCVENLIDCKFLRKNNKKSYPYYYYSTDDWVYLIYTGISGNDYRSFPDEYYNDYTSPYLITLDSLHQNQKKYIFVQCKKDFFENFDDFNHYDYSSRAIYDIMKNHIINYLMIFYQD